MGDGPDGHAGPDGGPRRRADPVGLAAVAWVRPGQRHAGPSGGGLVVRLPVATHPLPLPAAWRFPWPWPPRSPARPPRRSLPRFPCAVAVAGWRFTPRRSARATDAPLRRRAAGGCDITPRRDTGWTTGYPWCDTAPLALESHPRRDTNAECYVTNAKRRAAARCDTSDTTLAIQSHAGCDTLAGKRDTLARWQCAAGRGVCDTTLALESSVGRDIADAG